MIDDCKFLSRMPRLVPLTEEQIPSVRKAALDDGHALLLPTHAVVRDGIVVGAFSVEAWMYKELPVVTMWLDTKRVRPRESFGLINTVENLVFGRGFEGGYVLVERSSPFFGVMPALGYREVGEKRLVVEGPVESAHSWDVDLVEMQNGEGWPVVVFAKGEV